MTTLTHSASEFAFKDLKFGTPTVMTGGAYFIKLSMHGLPIYMQTGICHIKLGTPKPGRRAVCDLVLTQDDEFVAWADSVEQCARDAIFANRDEWFATPLDMHDIEHFMAPIAKFTKAAKGFTMRVSIPVQPELKVYDESHTLLPFDDLLNNSAITAVVEIKGIRCSARSFAFEVEARQMLAISDIDPFAQCVISRPGVAAFSKFVPISKPDIISLPSPSLPSLPSINGEVKPELGPQPGPGLEPDVDNTTIKSKPGIVFSPETKPDTNVFIETDIMPYGDLEDEYKSLYKEIDEDDTDSHVSLNLDEYIISQEPEKDEEELAEVDIVLDTEPAEISIERRSDIHCRLYRDAREKARDALEAAIAAHATALAIKDMYLLTIHDETDDIGPLPARPPM